MLKSARQTRKCDITLHPVSSGGNRRRLGLYTAEFREYVQDKTIKKLYIDLGDGVLHEIPALDTYVHGSITNPIINDWLHQYEWITPSEQLLFVLEVDDARHIHTYHFIRHL